MIEFRDIVGDEIKAGADPCHYVFPDGSRLKAWKSIDGRIQIEGVRPALQRTKRWWLPSVLYGTAIVLTVLDGGGVVPLWLGIMIWVSYTMEKAARR